MTNNISRKVEEEILNLRKEGREGWRKERIPTMEKGATLCWKGPMNEDTTRHTSFKFKNTRDKWKILISTTKRGTKSEKNDTGLNNNTGSWRTMTVPSKFWKKRFQLNYIQPNYKSKVRTDQYIFRYLESQKKMTTLGNFAGNFWRMYFIKVRVKQEKR